MKTQLCLLLSACLLFGAAASARGEETKTKAAQEPTVEEMMAKFVKLGPGVYAVEKDKKGRILSCIVVGQSRISTVLGKGKGLEVARQKADLDSSAQFVKWLKEEVTVKLSSDEETVVLMEGTEGDAKDSTTESGKSVDRNSKKMESVSKGLVRGLQIIYKDVNRDGKNYTLVKGWKADNANGVKRLQAELASDQPNSRSGQKGAQQRPNAKAEDKRIDNDSAASDDAADYLKK